ncbi:MAG TPA: S9 family peptidase [Acidobacteriota bacterium]|nr:S9 family peptidase [Acidobacteriota bacterium]
MIFRKLHRPAWLGLVVSCLLAIALLRAEQLTPPAAKTELTADTIFDTVLTDEYSWLRGKEKPEVIDYLKAENAYTAAVMKHTEPLQEKLYAEMKARIKETDLSVPVRHGDFYYYDRMEEGKQYRIYCRKKGSLDAQEQVLLDVNVLAEGKYFMDIGPYAVSPDHSLLAYGTDDDGSERYSLRIKDLDSGELYPDAIENVTSDVVWANDNQTLFYTVPDDAWRPYRLYRHRLGADPSEDTLVYEEDDDAFWLGIERTKSDVYLLLEAGSQTSTEIRFLRADDPYGRFRLIHPRQPKMEYGAAHHGDRFYIWTNEEATNFKLLSAPVDDPRKENWVELIPHRDSVKIDGVEMFADFMVVYERKNGLKAMRVTDLAADETHYVTFPEPVYTFYGHDNPEFRSETVRLTYTSLITPNSIYDYNMRTRERELKKRKEVLGGYDPGAYESKRLFATTCDSTRVPISLVYRKGLVTDGDNPTLLYGYGAYGISMDPWFSTNRISYLDRGFVWAVAHVRGGGEMGRRWYEDGRLLNKKNTFTDFIACAEYLIEQKYTRPEKLAVAGGSAGGLLIGAVVNVRSDLFQAVVADVPFVDIMNTMLDESIPLTVIEYDEWGNPNVEEYFRYMLSYSPYDNVRPKNYPNLLITAGINDTRVHYWEPAKWTARLRAVNTGSNRLLLKTNMGAGHSGASGRYDYLREIAFEYAFVLDCLGITE